ncbi:CapA family protein [Marinobacter orientalis]|uniref:CapA family protein n=1 Tax=Marinobacter orientalis TaxID=1928859 RepID=A0A7Y0NJ34_9GAMM|nr:CapA family protein [Marinobacter orientalis]NMT62079.1 CapA family protein [Marinobacter orientalis]TGX50802.1 CapA family protein [Marinobacter orientalis]
MTNRQQTTTLFLCGDVMTGRGIDQVQANPCSPELYEPWVKNARDYVALAEIHSGPVQQPVSNRYIWGDALDELDGRQPDLRFINLETSITTSQTPWPGKGIHYRMHPDNIGCLEAARPDGCSLANNHVLDWDLDGLDSTLEALTGAGIIPVGAGKNETEAARPGVFSLTGGQRILVFACCLESSGVPENWAATSSHGGVYRLPDLSGRSVDSLANRIRAARKPGDLVMLSIHWGGNWGYRIEPEQQLFAHSLIEKAGVDLIHGHSSHHPRGIEVYQGKLILYGCGDFLNDYEGIGGDEDYRGDLTLMYFPVVSRQTGKLQSLSMVAMQLGRLQLHHAEEQDRQWLATTLSRVGQDLGTHCTVDGGGDLVLGWK